jgi:dTDP-4-amino-4,6-dideoxygalactose transaminase
MARIQENIQHRKELTGFYQRELPKIGFAPLAGNGVGEWPLLRYPVRVQNKDEVLSQAVRRGVEIGSWFEVPLHPAGTRMADFDYQEGICPQAESACREVINLPTHLKVGRATAEGTLDFLRKVAVAAGCPDEPAASPCARN